MFQCLVTEIKHGVETTKEVQTIEEAREFGRKHARVVHYDEMKYFYYYVEIRYEGAFIECIHPQS
jgi:hypothetical protein